MKRHWTDDLMRGREWTRAFVLGDAACDQAIATGAAPANTKRPDTPVVIDHEKWITGVIHGFVAGMNDGRNPSAVAQTHCDTWAKIAHQMGELLDHPMAMVYGCPWMPRNVRNVNGVTVKLQDADADTLAKVRAWNDAYQRPVCDPFPAVMPQCYLALKDGMLPPWEIYWLHAQIAEARRMAEGRQVVPIVSIRDLGKGAIMRIEDWRQVVYALWSEGVQRVVVWEWTAQPLAISCEPDYPPNHGGRPIQAKHRERISADLGLTIDWAATERDLMHDWLSATFRRLVAPYVAALDAAAAASSRRSPLPVGWASDVTATMTGLVGPPLRGSFRAPIGSGASQGTVTNRDTHSFPSPPGTAETQGR